MSTIFDEYDKHVQNERWNEACKLARQISESMPDDPTAWFNLGVCLDETNQHFEASHAFQQCLVNGPEDDGAVFRMLRSLLLADRHDVLFEELRIYSYETPELVQEIADLKTFQNLFQSNPRFASLLETERSVGASETQRHQNLTRIAELGFRLPDPIPDRRIACPGFLRFIPEIGLRALSLRCAYAWLMEDIDEVEIKACINSFGGFQYLMNDEQGVLRTPRDLSQNHYSHFAGWFLERMLPLAWILGFPELHVPDGSPLNEEMMTELSTFIGAPCVVDNVWNWQERFTDQRPQSRVAGMEDLHFLSQVAVQSARNGEIDSVPDGFDVNFHGGVVLERWGSLTWALTPGMPLHVELF